ncbi:MAG: hypothetical protein RLZZ458_2095, partial [Planctomycetota bacterium]
VYQINEGGRRLLFVAQERTKESLAQFFRILKADNCKAKLTMKKAYGFKSYNVAEVALLHTPGSCRPHKPPTDSGEEAENTCLFQPAN